MSSAYQCFYCKTVVPAGLNHNCWRQETTAGVGREVFYLNNRQVTREEFYAPDPTSLQKTQTSPGKADAGLVEELRELHAFLNGTGPLAGGHFGDKRGSGAFWWRRYLDVIEQAASTLSTTGVAAENEACAAIAAATTAYDDGLQKSAGCSTTGQRIAKAIRARRGEG